MTARIEQDSTLELDSDDRKILALIQDDINISQLEIANKLNKIQPVIGARILKLERKHVLATQYGIDFSTSKIHVCIARLYAKNSRGVFDSISNCPYVVNAFKTLGRMNFTVVLAGASIEKIEEIVEIHFLSNPDVRYVEMAVVLEPINHAILPVDFNMEAHDEMKCDTPCHESAIERKLADGDYEPTKGGTLGKLLNLDDDDKRIIMQLQKDPETAQEELGKLISKSKSFVNARMEKLARNGVLAVRKGVNYKLATGIQLTQVSISTTDVQSLLQRLGSCKIIALGFQVLNEHPFIIYIGGSSMEAIEEIVDTCIRSDKNVTFIETEPIIEYLHDLILPYNFNFDFDIEDRIECSGCSFTTTKLTKALDSSMF